LAREQDHHDDIAKSANDWAKVQHVVPLASMDAIEISNRPRNSKKNHLVANEGKETLEVASHCSGYIQWWEIFITLAMADLQEATR